MKTGLLIRVGIDSTAGNWNAPCSSDGRFCYVPMGSSDDLSTRHNYQDYQPFVDRFAKSIVSPHKLCCWPAALPRYGHFDPDFKHCTYGDGGGTQRGERIWDVLKKAGEPFVVFYAGLRDIDTGALTYSIIGFYWIKRLLRVSDIPKTDWHRNEHTRWLRRSPNDVVIFGDTSRQWAGRIRAHIPIGSYRSGAWRVTKPLLRAWGGLDVKDGYIQRSFFLPGFLKPERFLAWLADEQPKFVRANNLHYPTQKLNRFNDPQTEGWSGPMTVAQYKKSSKTHRVGIP